MRIPPIASLEFATIIQRAIPPTGWSDTLAVANSGGPDSTCLLFLLNRYVLDAQKRSNATSTHVSPRRIVSLSIDHDLQASSVAMAEQAANIAKTLGVEHVTAKLPWGQPGCPNKPGPGDKIEELARDMRQMTLFGQMKKFNANALATGHHADDQVETMLMRMGRGSGQLGLAGMRSCRRWGMGTGSEIDDKLYGIDGMRTWMLRPLLGVSKDRILATCEEHNLEYVTDPTNFQPQLTIRNSIRHILSNPGTGLSATNGLGDEVKLPSVLADQIADIHAASANSAVPDLGLESEPTKLRKINMDMIAMRDEIDAAMDDIIATKRLPSSPGTFLISALDLRSIESASARETLLYRITRYVSPEPWGSPRAELGRRKTSLQRLLHHLLNFRDPISVGSGVLWRPAQIRRGELRMSFDPKDTSPLLWIASRQPPYLKNRAHRDTERSSDGLRMDITPIILEEFNALQADRSLSKVEVLFDRRFLVTVHVDQAPELDPATSVVIQAASQWTLPEVILVKGKLHGTIHSYIPSGTIVAQDRPRHRTAKDTPRHIKSDWITIESFRPLSAI